jgi:hypothetical protein
MRELPLLLDRPYFSASGRFREEQIVCFDSANLQGECDRVNKSSRTRRTGFDGAGGGYERPPRPLGEPVLVR